MATDKHHDPPFSVFSLKALESPKLQSPNCIIPLFLLLFLLLEFLQIPLGHLNDLAGLLLRCEEAGGEGAGAAIQRGSSGSPREVLPEVLVNSLTLKKFGSEVRKELSSSVVVVIH